MKTVTSVFLILMVSMFAGCKSKGDPRVQIKEGVGSDTLGSNIVIRPVAHAFSALIGEGIVVDQATLRRNDAGMMELYINGHNDSYNTKRFRYKIDWLDQDGMVIDNRTSVWLPGSATGKAKFSLKAVAPSAKAVDFRMDTRKWE